MSYEEWIPYGRHSISEEDINAVIETLKSDWLTTGPKVIEFENRIAEFCMASQAVVFCNATAALHTACQALEVGSGDIVWTSPNTFVASANCAVYCGARIDFVDVDQDTYNMSIESLEEKLLRAKKENCLPKVVIPVHFSGQSCDMRAIYKLSQEYGFGIIEDASHAIGAQYYGKPVGSCEYSDITIFSFHPVKVMTTGEGGAALTNNPAIAEHLKLLRSHGITRNTAQMLNEPEGPWYTEQIELGMNYRITDLQCALGISQLKRLDFFIEKRQLLAKNYNELLKNLPIKLPIVDTNCFSSFHLYPIQIICENKEKKRLELFNYLHQNKIGVQVHYRPVHLHPYYRQRFGFKVGDFPKAEHYYQGALSLPLYADLTEEQQHYIFEKLRESLL